MICEIPPRSGATFGLAKGQRRRVTAPQDEQDPIMALTGCSALTSNDYAFTPPPPEILDPPTSEFAGARNDVATGVSTEATPVANFAIQFVEATERVI